MYYRDLRIIPDPEDYSTPASEGKWVEGRLRELYLFARHPRANHTVLLWIDKRRPGCDRGRYLLNVDGLHTIDSEDGFPRYFMDLARAE